MIREIRKRGRKLYDSFYCKPSATKLELGKGCTWFVETKNLNENSIIYSGGAGNDISFELELLTRFNCKVLLFDPSDTGVNTVNQDLNGIPGLDFKRFGLDARDGLVQFSKPKNTIEGSYSVKREGDSENTIYFYCRSISSLMKEFAHSKIDLLKIDIEGFEFGVIEDIVVNRLNVGQICVEFHHFFEEIPKSKTQSIIRLLEKNGYEIIHKKMCDYTFLRR